MRTLRETLSWRAALGGALVVALALNVCGQESSGEKPRPAEPKKPTLAAGDKAPALSIEKWVKGDEVKGFEKGKLYVVEFWATWCGPCVASMPHLSALQAEYKGKITFIGCTTADSHGNTLEKVEAMVKDKGDKMAYTVAWDKERTTYDAFMTAAGQNGIPCSFVVDGTGTIAWIGHPMSLDLVLDKVVAGQWDAKADSEKFAAAEKALIDISRKVMTNPADAVAALEQFKKDYAKFESLATGLDFTVYFAAKEWDKGYVAAKRAVDKAISTQDWVTLNSVAWTIVDPEGKVEKKDLDLALHAATKANELSGDKDPAVLDTLARVYFVKGNVEKAIEIETRAVANAQEPMKAELQKSLDEFRAKVTK